MDRRHFTVEYRPRDRWLTQTEARDLLLALAPSRRLWVMLALYTLRRSEIERLAGTAQGRKIRLRMAWWRSTN